MGRRKSTKKELAGSGGGERGEKKINEELGGSEGKRESRRVGNVCGGRRVVKIKSLDAGRGEGTEERIKEKRDGNEKSEVKRKRRWERENTKPRDLSDHF